MPYRCVIELLAHRLSHKLPQGGAPNPSEANSGSETESEDDFLCPDFSSMPLPPSQINAQSPLMIAQIAFDKYDNYHKGFVEHNSSENRRFNKDLVKKYNQDPRIFWSNPTHANSLPTELVSFAHFCHSVRSASANSEREFSRMRWMISPRRSAITSENADKRLTLENQLPQKRRLESQLREKGVKRQKLFHPPSF